MLTEPGVCRATKVSPVLWYPQVATAGEKSPPFERILCGQRPRSVGLRRFPKFCTVTYCYHREGGYGGRKRENNSRFLYTVDNPKNLSFPPPYLGVPNGSGNNSCKAFTVPSTHTHMLRGSCLARLLILHSEYSGHRTFL